MDQLFFKLTPQNPFSLDYFVPHSGVAGAMSRLTSAIEDFQKNPDKFYFVLISGPKGSGKSHLLNAFSLDSDGASFYDVSSKEDLDDKFLSSFVADYEQKRNHGGLILFAMNEGLASNPHLTSRLKNAEVLELCYPEESELPTLIKSILERKNLSITDYSLNYLLKRLPSNPLSFDNIFARIDELSLSQNRPAGLGLIRDALIINDDGE